MLYIPVPNREVFSMMNDNDPKDPGPAKPFLDERGRPRVRSARTPDGPVDYRPGEMLVDLGRIEGARTNPEIAIDLVREFADLDAAYDRDDLARVKSTGFARMTLSDPDADALVVARRINTGIDAEGSRDGNGPFRPNVVFHIGAMQAAPMRFAGAFGADPMRFASDYGVDPMRFANSSTARPAAAPGRDVCGRAVKGPGVPIVAILDTGFPLVGTPGDFDLDFKGLGDGVRERPDDNGDDYLDIAAGHSTFIRTIIERASPTVQFVVEGVMTNDGDGSESDIANALFDVFDRVDDKTNLIVNLSFSGYYLNDQEPEFVAAAIRALVAEGAVVVAAAGNDGDCRPKHPAAMSEVLAVGSVGPCGPSWFSNHGPWVDACAPGEDIVSQFFTFDGDLEPVADSTAPDIDEFAGWALWSGTSFAAPNVVGALCEIIELNDCTAKQALKHLVKRRGLIRIPDFGVVVNRSF